MWGWDLVVKLFIIIVLVCLFHYCFIINIIILLLIILLFINITTIIGNHNLDGKLGEKKSMISYLLFLNVLFVYREEQEDKRLSQLD